MEMPIFYVNFSSLNYPNLKDESLGPYGWFDKNVQSLVLKYGVLWRMARSCHASQNSIHKDQTLDIFIKSTVSLKMSILQIWVTWASKITFKNSQLCSIKIKGSHAPWTSHAAALYGISYRIARPKINGTIVAPWVTITPCPKYIDISLLRQFSCGTLTLFWF